MLKMPSRKKGKRNRENLKIKFLKSTSVLKKNKTCDSLNLLVEVVLENVEQEGKDLICRLTKSHAGIDTSLAQLVN